MSQETNPQAIRILQILPGGRVRGGIENFVMNYYRNIDRDKIQFDFLVHYSEQGYYDEEIKQLGGRIYYFTAREDKKIFSYMQELKYFFLQHKEYRVIHGHMPGFAPLYFHVAKKCKVPIRIAHSHVTTTEPTKKGKVLNQVIKLIKYESNKYWACSQLAGEYMFGKQGKFTVIPNAISTERFFPDNSKRNEMRKKLNLQSNFVIGNIGRFCPQKNQLFLIDVFTELYKSVPHAALLLVGEGDMEDKLRKKVMEKNIRRQVFFVKPKENIEDYYQAMDVFVLPSIFEGLGIVAVEAQASGLPCVLSTEVPDEAAMTKCVKFVNLEQPVEQWVKAICEAKKPNVDMVQKRIMQRGYEIKNAAKRLEDQYVNLYKEGLYYDR